AMAKMNMFLHDYTNSSFAIGDTFRKPGFGPEGTLLKFDYVVANPMWLREAEASAFGKKNKVI
ncbi:MAG: N-6 DNA methylase, partial [Methanothrix sp.]